MEQYSVEAILSLVDRGFTDGMSKAEKLVNGFNKNVGKVSQKMVDVGKTMTASISAPIGAGVVAAVKSFGDLEQAYGGIETMFKGSANEVISNARKAYETAGVSGTKYMEQVTSFSASLIQGLDGDTAKAAKIADRAIRDMSDNSNKFGTTIGSIQDAYQGFAKGNFTMLDNLKLGGHNRLAQLKPLENGGTLNVLRRRQYRVNYELKVA